MNAIPFTFDASSHTFLTDNGRRLSVTQILNKVGVCDFSFVDQETRLMSMARGNSVHWLCQLEDENALNYRTVPRWLRGFRRGWNLWKKRSAVQITGIESQFVSRFGFAGIIDRTGTFPPSVFLGAGTSAVIDIKSGSVPDWVALQLAAYAVWAAGDNPKKAEYVRRIAVRLSEDGSYYIREFPLCSFKSDWARFVHYLRRAVESPVEVC
jgi:hypothetical protein